MKQLHHAFALVLSLTAVAVLAACSREARPREPAPRLVYVHQLPQVSDSESLQATVHARQEVELGFRSGGRVQERLVDAGQRVRAGQLLARLDPAEQQLALKAAHAQLSAAELDRAQQQRDAERLERLTQDGSVGVADAERQRTSASAAQERVLAARTQLALAQERLSHTELRAPFDGVITFTRADRGQVLAEGTPLLHLAHTGQLELQLDLPPALAAQAATLKAEALDRRWRLRELQGAAHPQTRTQRARFTPEGSPLVWNATLLGRSVPVKLHGVAATPRLRLPASALVASAGETGTLWRVVDQKLQGLSVRIEGREGDAALVSGVPAGATVVMFGAHRLEAGQTVRTLPLERAP